jgi:hypothetical protein
MQAGFFRGKFGRGTATLESSPHHQKTVGMDAAHERRVGKAVLVFWPLNRFGLLH